MVPYRRKRTYRKKSTLRRLTKPRKTTAIQTLAKQVVAIKRSMRKAADIQQYSFGTRVTAGGSIGDGIVGPAYIFHINSFNQWSRIFGTGQNDQEANAMIWKSFGMDIHVRSYNETSEINFTMFIVKATDLAANNISSTGALTITEGTDYVNSSGGANDVASGLVLLNKKLFTILYTKRFTLGNNSVALGTSTAQTQFGTDRRFYFKCKPNKKVTNPSTGDVFALQRDLDPSGNYYMLIFSNNSSADAENPRCFVNMVHTVQMLN